MKAKVFFYLGALAAFVVSFVVFLKTMAPTVSFWDCGEFIASSKILGVPHPPGTPLFILIGRFFIMLGQFSSPPLNTNFISVICSSLTAVVSYIIVVKIAHLILGHGELADSRPSLEKIGVYAGGLVGGLILAFSSTFWFNAVETEVYGLAMLLMVLITYMIVIWSEKKYRRGNDTLLVAIAYLLFLSIGIHLTAFLMVPAVVAYIVLVDSSKLKDWRFWATWGILFSFAMPIYFPLQLIFPTLMDYQIETWLILMVGLTAYFGYKSFRPSEKYRSGWNLYFALMLAGIIGFSTHLYIPLRAAQKPAINENNPDNWQRLKGYLERKQYGQESMITRMFTRRGKLKNQFGDYPHMGFWGYFKEQYSNDKWSLLRYLPFLLGLFGMYISLRSSFRNGFLLAAIFLISSVGLILYLNFADGTRGDQLEVRDRDYFFTPAFLYFAILIGLGLSVFLARLPAWCKNRLPALPAYLIWTAALIISLLLPVDTLTYHYRTHDRTGDFMPPDYAYNILNSCDENGILFTNGDNDTFPLWYLQEVENIRKDVRVINLSLLNTDWYIMQLKNQMGVPIGLTDAQILWFPFERRGQITLYRPREPFYDPVRGRNRYLAAFQDGRTGNVIRVQDQMIEHIVLTNKWQYPIYFSTSVPQSNRWTLSDYTVRKAMVLQIMPEKPQETLDPIRTEQLIYDVYRYRGVDDLAVFKDENNVGLTTTYPERFIELSEYYQGKGDSVPARRILRDAIDRFPLYYQLYIELSNLYSDTSAFPDSARYYYDRGVDNLQAAIKAWPKMTLYWQFLGVLYTSQKDNEGAIRCYEKALKLDPSSNITFRLLMQLYTFTGDRDKGFSLLEYWIDEHPEDMEARNMYNVYKRYNR